MTDLASRTGAAQATASACGGTWQASPGPTVTIRPIRPDDLERERAFLRELSEHSRYQRLMSSRSLLPGELERLTRIDPEREIALVATVGQGTDERQVGVARLVREADPANAEFAIVVADAWHGRGLGRRLLLSLMECAERAGIARLGAYTFATNTAMLALARALDFSVLRVPGDGTVRQLARTLRARLHSNTN